MPEPQIEKEIAQLEQQLQIKRQELRSTEGRTAEKMPSDEELLHKAVGERIQQQMPAYQPTQVPSTDTGASWQDPAIAQQVQSLVNIAFTKSLAEAIGDAVKSHNSALIDAFHDLLRDKLVQELVKRGKLSPPAVR